MKLNLVSFLLPFQASIAPAPGPQFDHGRGHQLASPADLQAGVAGLIAMSRTLWLETLHATEDSAREVGQDMINDIVLEANALVVYNLTVGESEPVKDDRSSHSLLTGVGNWGYQTAAFLNELAKSTQKFKDVKLNEVMAGNLTTLKTCSTDFCHSFVTPLPQFEDSFSKMADGLAKAFDNAIGALKDG